MRRLALFIALILGLMSTSGHSQTGDGSLLNNAASQSTVTATLANAGGYKVWGNCTGSSAQPSYCSLVNAMFPTSGVTPGSYTCSNVTVNAQGIVTAAASGSCGAGSAGKFHVKESKSGTSIICQLSLDVQ